MSNQKQKRERKPFRVWSAVTVFVQGEGDRNPWTKRSHGKPVTVSGVSFDNAMHLAERELARELAERYNLVPGK